MLLWEQMRNLQQKLGFWAGRYSRRGLFIQLLNPSSFNPVLALIGIIYFLFVKNQKKKDIGLILLGFATLIYGMGTMSAAVEPLGQMEGFRNLFVAFSNPILGVLVGAIVTGIIQSSSASVGILQALSATGQITMGAAIPIIMGQNIGTCVTALISSVGANKNARRAALVHLYFNIIGSGVFITLFIVLNNLFNFAFVNQAAITFISQLPLCKIFFLFVLFYLASCLKSWYRLFQMIINKIRYHYWMPVCFPLRL